MLAFILGIICGVIITLLTMLVFFAVGYNTIGTLMQIFNPDVFIPTLRQLQKAQREKDIKINESND